MAQESASISQNEKDYFEFLNYTPKNFKIDSKNKPPSKFLKGKLNSLWRIKSAYELKGELNKQEIKWLEDQIDQLAVAYFLEKKLVFLESVADYSGCPEQLLSTEFKNEINITTLSICQEGCIVNKKIEQFIQIFNNRTEKLLLNSNKNVDY